MMTPRSMTYQKALRHLLGGSVLIQLEALGHDELAPN